MGEGLRLQEGIVYYSLRIFWSATKDTPCMLHAFCRLRAIHEQGKADTKSQGTCVFVWES